MSKRRFLISPLAAAATLLAFGAQAQVTVQGFADGAWRSVSNSKGTVQSVVSGSGTTSRLIFRGTEDLGGGWSAGFWLESTFFIDSGNVTTTQFFDRQSTVRLAGPMGEFRMGRDWVPSFMSYAAADIMGYVGVGVAGNLISATGMEAIKRAFGTFTPTTSRSNNSIEYLTPASLGNLYGHAMIAFSEDSNSAGNFKLKGGRMGYRASGWDVSAHYTGTQIQATGATWSQSGLTALWTMRGTGIRVNGALLDTKYLSSKQSNLMLGAGFPVGVQEFKVTYGRANQSGTNAAGASIDANDAQLYGVSYVYNLSKRSALYANAARVQNKGAATYTIAGGSAGAAPGTAHRGFELGMRHAF